MVILCETGEDVQVDGKDLVGAKLAGLLHRALLGGQRATLSEAFMRSGIFEGAIFDGADLSATDFGEADLKGTSRARRVKR
ncbi:MAG: pentapeptide repeat-containing protein [Myxococcaceae bacterium]